MKQDSLLRPLAASVVVLISLALLYGWLNHDSWPAGPRADESGLEPRASTSFGSKRVDRLTSAPKKDAKSESVRESVESDEADSGGLHTFRFRAVDHADEPLSGVRVEVHCSPEAGDAIFTGTTGGDGVCVLDLPKGTYRISALHDYYIQSSNGRKRGEPKPGMVHVPCDDIESRWLEVYVCGYQLLGTDARPGTPRVRLSMMSMNLNVVRGMQGGSLSFRTMVQQRWGEQCIACFPRSEDPLTRKLTVFDREKGPCEFSLPVVKLRDFAGPTICDVSRSEFVEAMAWIEVRVIDAAGVEVAPGTVHLVRDKRYHGFQFGGLKPNERSWVPAGTYTVNPQSMPCAKTMGLKSIELAPRGGQVVKFVYPVEMYPVEFVSPKAFSARDVTAGDGAWTLGGKKLIGFGKARGMRFGEVTPMFLPVGTIEFVRMSFGGDGKVLEKVFSFVVKATRERQRFRVE